MYVDIVISNSFYLNKKQSFSFFSRLSDLLRNSDIDFRMCLYLVTCFSRVTVFLLCWSQVRKISSPFTNYIYIGINQNKIFVWYQRFRFYKVTHYELQHLGQPVAEVLAYLHVQISPISCNVVGSICMCLEKTLTQQLQATGGQGWRETTPCTELVQKSQGCLISFELYCMGFQNFVVSNSGSKKTNELIWTHISCYSCHFNNYFPI